MLSALDKLEEPPSLIALRAAVTARLPRVDLPELLLEIHARTGFAGRASVAAGDAGWTGTAPSGLRRIGVGRRARCAD